MASVPSKSKDAELIIEEEAGTIELIVQKVSPPQNEKRKRLHESSHELPNKYRPTSDGSRVAPAPREASLPVPFWKQLNSTHASSQCQTRRIGHLSLLKRIDDKECFEDRRFLRGKWSVSLLCTVSDQRFLFD